MADQFRVFAPLAFFTKGDTRKIAGVISTEDLDQEGERILQRGLDFSYFLDKGWYNDNHSRKTADAVGYPESVKQFRAGDKLPDGMVAKSNCTWAEGRLLRTKAADEIWELGKALVGTPRQLGFSVEGKIQKRSGKGNNTIARALVREVAVTRCPVNPHARLSVLAKSLQAIEAGSEGQDDKDLFRSLTMGTATPGVKPVGPRTGEGAGQIITGQSLERDDDPPKRLDKKKKEEDEEVTGKSLTDAEAWVRLKRRLPLATSRQIGLVLDLTKKLKRMGRLG